MMTNDTRKHNTKEKKNKDNKPMFNGKQISFKQIHKFFDDTDKKYHYNTPTITPYIQRDRTLNLKQFFQDNPTYRKQYSLLYTWSCQGTGRVYIDALFPRGWIQWNNVFGGVSFDTATYEKLIGEMKIFVSEFSIAGQK